MEQHYHIPYDQLTTTQADQIRAVTNAIHQIYFRLQISLHNKQTAQQIYFRFAQMQSWVRTPKPRIYTDYTSDLSSEFQNKQHSYTTQMQIYTLPPFRVSTLQHTSDSHAYAELHSTDDNTAKQDRQHSTHWKHQSDQALHQPILDTKTEQIEQICLELEQDHPLHQLH